MNFIKELLLQNKFKVIFFLCASIATSLLGVGVLAFINNYLLKMSEQSFMLVLAFSLMLVVFFASSVLVELALSVFGQNFIFKMQRRVVKQILDTAVLKIDQIGKAKLLASLTADVRTVSFGLLRFPDFIQSNILIICTSIYLCYLSPRVFLLCFCVIAFIFAINHIFMKKTYQYFKRSRDNDDALQNDYQNIIDGRKELTLNAFRAKFYYENDFEVNARAKKHNNTMSNVMQSLSSNWTNVSLLALVGLEFYFSLFYKWASFEDATTIALAIFFLRTPLFSMISTFPTLLMAKVALDKIENLDLTPYQSDFELDVFRGSWKSIHFKDVAFSYNDKFSLKPTTLDINKGELIFLIGKNGSGKSTFSMLLSGLVQPQEGAIYLDDILITKENLSLYRSLITAIFSDFHLFSQTLKDEDFAHEDQVKYWLEILELENKTTIENNALQITKLSTGQKKRLAMLIALLEERDMLILDEWAADQDPVFRKFFYLKLLPLLKQKGKTIFAISHDDAYFDMADRIFLAQNGLIRELKGENIKEIAKNVVEHF